MNENKALVRRALLLLFSAVIVNQLLWITAAPPFQAPDEIKHFIAVEYLAQKGEWPDWRDRSLLSREAVLTLEPMGWNATAFEPLFHRSYAPSILERDRIALESIPSASRFQHETTAGDLGSDSWRYPPLYYEAAALFQRLFLGESLFVRVTALRLVSLLFALGTAAFAYWTGRILFRNVLWALSFTAIVAFHPLLSFMGSVINPEIGLYFFFSGAVAIGLSFYHKALPENSDVLLLGLWIGLGCLLKPTMIALLPWSLLIVLLVMSEGRLPLKKAASAGAVLLFSSGILIALIPLRNLLIMGNLKGYAPFEIHPLSIGPMEFLRQLNDWIPFSSQFSQFWGVFGWMDTPVPKTVRYALFGVCVLAIFSWVRMILLCDPQEGMRSVTGNRSSRWRMIGLMALAFLFYGGTLIASFYTYYRETQHYMTTQGRHWGAALVPLTFFLVWGLVRLFPASWRDRAWIGLAILMTAYSSYCLWIIVLPRYVL